MEQKELEALSNDELLNEYKKSKSNNLINALLIGVLIGISVYSLVKNGIGFFMLFPIFFVFILSKSRKNIKVIENEIDSRKLQ